MIHGFSDKGLLEIIGNQVVYINRLQIELECAKLLADDRMKVIEDKTIENGNLCAQLVEAINNLETKENV